MADSLEVRLHEAAATGLGHREFLELLLQDELLVRNSRLLNRRTAAAGFRDTGRLEDFDFGFNPSIKKDRVSTWPRAASSATPRRVARGTAGHRQEPLGQALGRAAIRSARRSTMVRSSTPRDFLHDEALAGQERILQRYLKPDLLIIDDMGMKQLPKRSGEDLFEIVLRRHEVKSTLMTSNRPLKIGQTVGRRAQPMAILDRFLHHAVMIR